jgi:protein-tyrosine phosphatase
MVSPTRRFRLVVLCTGNTCRSPLAAAAFREELGEDLERVEIVSAGTAAAEGQPASAGALRCLSPP